jgi:low affinity Fe/Cu permease
MTNPIDPVVLDLNAQLDEIIRQLQLAREEFVILEARMAQREKDNEPIH